MVLVTRRQAWRLVLVLCTTLQACTERSTAGAGSGYAKQAIGSSCEARVDVADVPLRSLRLAPDWDAQEILLEEVKSAVIAADHSVVVVDGRGRAVLFIGRNGTLLRRVGREGDGPNEYRYPVHVSLLDDSLVKVFDASHWRITTLRTDGSLIGTARVPHMAEFGQAAALVTTPGGEVYMLSYEDYQTTLAASVAPGRKGIGRGEVHVVRLDSASGAWGRRFSVPGLETWVDLDSGTLRSVWFAAESALAAGDSVIWSADARKGTLFYQTPDGEGVCYIAVQASPVAITPAERDSFALAKDLVARGPDRVTRARSNRRGLSLPAARPVIMALSGGNAGLVWVRVADDDPRADDWLGLSRQARKVVRVRLPDGSLVLDHRDGLLLVRTMDESGVHQLRVYRLDR